MSDRVIPYAAVEAAALSLYERDYGVTDWSIVSGDVRSRYLEEATAALEAAAPHMLAEARAAAWDEGMHAAKLESLYLTTNVKNPYRGTA